MIKRIAGGHQETMAEAGLSSAERPAAHLVVVPPDRSVEMGACRPQTPAGGCATTYVASRANEARLRTLVQEHFDFIWRSLRRLGVPHTDVDDCAQQVFWVAARKLAIITEGSERAFLFSTALRVASDARRSRVRRREVQQEDDAHQTCDAGPRPDEIADQRRARALLDDVLAQMPLDLRTVFVLFELEEMPTQEIATVLDLPTGTVASRLRRAREEFQKLVRRLQARAVSRSTGAQRSSVSVGTPHTPAAAVDCVPIRVIRGGKL
jgi:RNA polymerase sigma-70 factor (ECF subfamily)